MTQQLSLQICFIKEDKTFYQRIYLINFWPSIKSASRISVSWVRLHKKDVKSIITKLALVRRDTEHYIDWVDKVEIRAENYHKTLLSKLKSQARKEAATT